MQAAGIGLFPAGETGLVAMGALGRDSRSPRHVLLYCDEPALTCAYDGSRRNPFGPVAALDWVQAVDRR